jgi:hypothetical protein
MNRNKLDHYEERDQQYVDGDNSIVDSRLNYTQSFVKLTDSNASLLEQRNRKYNVFNTYSSVKNPKNILVRKDRSKALRDLVQQNSTCSSGFDITILQSTDSTR